MRWLSIIFLSGFLAACSSGGTTDPPADSSLFTEDDSETGGFTTTVEAGGRYSTKVIYFSFADGEEHFPSEPSDSGDWDLSFRFAWIQLNGGSNGTGGVELMAIDFAEYLDFEIAPSGEYLTDAPSALAFDDGQGWYRYFMGTDTWAINDRIYVVKARDGRYYKLRVVTFLDEFGIPGFLQFRWAEIAPPV